MLHFLAKQLVMLILCPYRSRYSKDKQSILHWSIPPPTPSCETEDGKGTFGLILCTGQREKEGCYTAA